MVILLQINELSVSTWVSNFYPSRDQNYYPAILAMSGSEMAPTLTQRSVGPLRSIIVDGTADFAAPPSRMRSTRSPRAAAAAAAVWGAGAPDGLALGAVNGRSAAVRKSRVAARPGMRSDTVSPNGLRAAQSRHSMLRGKIRVRGPGQKVRARRSARSSNIAISRAAGMSATSTSRGLSGGRFLALKTRATASALVASAPSP